MRFRLAYTPIFRWSFVPLGLGPKHSWVEVDDTRVVAQMGIGFRTSIPRANVVGVSMFERRTFSRGVHGWRGRWLVNGSGANIVAIDIEPRVRGWVMGFPVRLRQLLIAVEDPAGLRTALGPSN